MYNTAPTDMMNGTNAKPKNDTWMMIWWLQPSYNVYGISTNTFGHILWTYMWYCTRYSATCILGGHTLTD